MKLSLAVISKQSEGCLVNFFNYPTNDFWFNFCPTRSDGLINSLLCNLSYLSRCQIDNTWCDFSNLIYNVSACISKVIAIEKPTCLSTFYPSLSASIFSIFSTSVWVNSYLDVFSSNVTIFLCIRFERLLFLAR